MACWVYVVKLASAALLALADSCLSTASPSNRPEAVGVWTPTSKTLLARAHFPVEVDWSHVGTNPRLELRARPGRGRGNMAWGGLELQHLSACRACSGWLRRLGLLCTCVKSHVV